MGNFLVTLIYRSLLESLILHRAGHVPHKSHSALLFVLLLHLKKKKTKQTISHFSTEHTPRNNLGLLDGFRK